MNMLSSLTTSDDITEDKDVLGGGFQPLESGLYPVTIKQAYVGEAQSGAVNVTFHFETEDEKEIKQTIYVTSGNAKGKKNYYVNAKGEKNYLPGFNVVNAISLLTSGKELGQLEPETKVVNLYNHEVSKEVPTSVPMLTELMDKEIILGMLKLVKNKMVKSDSGYVPTAETREENELAKVFRKRDGMTVAEIKAEATEALFMDKWAEKNTGKVVDKTDPSAVARTGAPPVGASQSPAPTKSLFA